MNRVIDWMAQQGHKDAMHVGDGCYASHDGWYLWLCAERENGIHYVGLEPVVFRSLLKWARKIEDDADNPGFWTGKETP